MNAFTSFALAGALALAAVAGAATARSTPTKEKKTMELGSFTLCLLVKDIKSSKEFYEKLDFKQVSGKVEQKWVVLKNGNTKIGLFQGLIDKNLMTFNPGQTSDKETLKDFDDVRALQRAFKERGIKLKTEADEKTTGAASITFTDPDGNEILFDQYVDSPKH
jgi:catechol 2,3-dioxygenase-like lactoylglutathione lyase family enzyme